MICKCGVGYKGSVVFCGNCGFTPYPDKYVTIEKTSKSGRKYFQLYTKEYLNQPK